MSRLWIVTLNTNPPTYDYVEAERCTLGPTGNLHFHTGTQNFAVASYPAGAYLGYRLESAAAFNCSNVAPGGK
jgi:hypothetical protein